MKTINEKRLAKLKKGDRGAFLHFYNHFFYKVFRQALAVVTRQDAETICADLFTKLWEKRAEFSTMTDMESFLLTGVQEGCLNFPSDETKKSPR